MVQPARPAPLLSSQTKCNTLRRWCCHGNEVLPAVALHLTRDRRCPAIRSCSDLPCSAPLGMGTAGGHGWSGFRTALAGSPAARAGALAEASPWTKAPSSPVTTVCTPASTCKLSSATSTFHGKRGGIENAIGRLRRSLPRKVEPHLLDQNHLATLAQNYNHTPRMPGFRTPAEIFSSQLLHFKCESTPSLRSG